MKKRSRRTPRGAKGVGVLGLAAAVGTPAADKLGAPESIWWSLAVLAGVLVVAAIALALGPWPVLVVRSYWDDYIVTPERRARTGRGARSAFSRRQQKAANELAQEWRHWCDELTKQMLLCRCTPWDLAKSPSVCQWDRLREVYLSNLRGSALVIVDKGVTHGLYDEDFRRHFYNPADPSDLDRMNQMLWKQCIHPWVASG